MKSNKIASGIVLAGGSARRMGGVNKALQTYNNRPLYSYATENLLHYCDEILISANADAPQFKKEGYRVVDDGKYFRKGPLAGVFAGLSHALHDRLLIAACDQLTLPVRVYAELIDSASNHRGAFASDGTSPHPTCAVVPRHLAEDVSDRLSTGRLRLLEFMQANCVEVEFPDVTFFNVNTLPRPRT